MAVFSTSFSPKPAAVVTTLGVALALAAFGGVSQANAVEPGTDDFLGTAETYAIVASDAITDASLPVSPSEVHGDVALTGTANGLTSGQVVNGTIHTADADATLARTDVNAAYVELAGQGATGAIVADLGFTPLYLPGVYNSTSSILLNGTITLDGLSNDQSVFIFQAGSDLTVGSNAQVLLINGAQSCNVYWQVGSSATIGTGADFVGTVVAATSITVNTGASVEGRLLASALNAGAVTLDDNLINAQSRCVRVSTSGGTTTTTTSENGTTTTVVVPPVVTPPVVTPPVVTTPTVTTPTRTTPVRTVNRDRLVNTGSLANTAANTPDSTTPLLASLSGLGVLVGVALLIVARRRGLAD